MQINIYISVLEHTNINLHILKLFAFLPELNIINIFICLISSWCYLNLWLCCFLPLISTTQWPHPRWCSCVRFCPGLQCTVVETWQLDCSCVVFVWRYGIQINYCSNMQLTVWFTIAWGKKASVLPRIGKLIGICLVAFNIILLLFDISWAIDRTIACCFWVISQTLYSWFFWPAGDIYAWLYLYMLWSMPIKLQSV